MKDIAVIGGGLAGSVLATKLAQRGMDVVLIERKQIHPPVFKAEKLEPDQWQILNKYHLLENVFPVCTTINSVQMASRGRLREQRPLRQYACLYHDLINQLRDSFPETLEVRWNSATSIQTIGEGCKITLNNGVNIRSRLTVIATGNFGPLQKQLGMSKRMISPQHSFVFGFNLNPQYFNFDALTYDNREVRNAVDYISLFRIPGAIRANMFTYWEAGNPMAAEMVRNSESGLEKALPGLEKVLGKVSISSRVEKYLISLGVCEQRSIPGVVVIGDAFQGVCPATGTGLSKVLTDVDLLLDDYVAQWFATPDISKKQISCFYNDYRKQISDAKSLNMALQRRRDAKASSNFQWGLMHMRRDCTKYLNAFRASISRQPYMQTLRKKMHN